MTDATERTRIALIGMGKMGRALDELAESRGCIVVARLDATAMAQPDLRAQLGGADVAIDFTQPDAAVANTLALLAAQTAVVIGTTGWDAHRDEIAAAAHASGRAALWSPNFSLGVQLFLAIAEEAGRRLREVPAFDTRILEVHHTAKRDAPSGTALAIQARLAMGLSHAPEITSLRVGAVPGTHTIVCDAPFEQIDLTHEARDRRVFADGALSAARWLARVDRPGLYTMQDMLARTIAPPLEA
ncbi:MAG: 4-hydroxy-tetrahydrodipicolinate reductase [Gemmatimonadaceae bacterium]|nr:4-hydroxy-tetrahydrodipicolinate reductase [Gemmatimonadaceae bacterium]